MVTRKLRELTDADIQRIADTYNAFVDGTLEDEKASVQLCPLRILPNRITSSHRGAMLASKNRKMTANRLRKNEPFDL